MLARARCAQIAPRAHRKAMQGAKHRRRRRQARKEYNRSVLGSSPRWPTKGKRRTSVRLFPLVAFHEFELASDRFEPKAVFSAAAWSASEGGRKGKKQVSPRTDGLQKRRRVCGAYRKAVFYQYQKGRDFLVPFAHHLACKYSVLYRILVSGGKGVMFLLTQK